MIPINRQKGVISTNEVVNRLRKETELKPYVKNIDKDFVHKLRNYKVLKVKGIEKYHNYKNPAKPYAGQLYYYPDPIDDKNNHSNMIEWIKEYFLASNIFDKNKEERKAIQNQKTRKTSKNKQNRLFPANRQSEDDIEWNFITGLSDKEHTREEDTMEFNLKKIW